MVSQLLSLAVGTLPLPMGQIVHDMLYLAVVFFVIALVAYVLGARGVAGMSEGIGRMLLIVGLILAILFVILGFANYHGV